MKRAWIASSIGVAALLMLFVVTCPDEEDYDAWLAEKHDITCEFSESAHSQVCKRGEESIEWQSKYVRSLPFYMQVVDDRYIADNKEYSIRAFGILNHFFDYSQFTIYN
jgi:hypothetical protein